MGFDSDIDLAPAGSGAWTANIAEGWWTPRGPLGGYVMAFGIRAMELTVADSERLPRSATMHFLRAPEAGELRVSAVLEREGRSLSSVSCRLEQGGNLIGLGVGAWSKPWEGPFLDEAPIPDAEPPDPGLPEAVRPNAPNAPPFLEQMDMQHRFGDPPFTGSEHSLTGGWIGLREERPIDAAVVAV